MRVPTLTIYQNSRNQLNNIVSQLNETNRIVSSGRRVNTVSDDPVAAKKVLGIESTLSCIDQFERNIDVGELWLTTGESALDTVQQSILDAKDIALTMSNDTYNEEDRETAADSVHQILLTIVDTVDCQVNGQYQFSGTKTDTRPYVLDDSGDPLQVYYQGNDDNFTIQIGQSSRMAVGYTGKEIFGDSDAGESLFDVLIQMEADLSDNNGGNLDAVIEELDAHFGRVTDTISDMGVKGNRLETTKNVISELNVNLMQNKSDLQDADIIEAITKLQQQQTAYEAALSASSKIMSLSLVNYV